jgi:opacity protein-like surface antigen
MKEYAMKRATTLAAAAVLLMAALLSAQAPPNFAGKWTLVPDPNAPAGGGRGMGGLGQAATIVQDASTLTITRTTQMGEFTSTYKLDGSESKNTLNFNGNAIEQLSKAKWDGGKLIVNTTMNFDGNPVETSMIMSVDGAGNLNIESTRPDFQGGGAPVTTKATYKKN